MASTNNHLTVSLYSTDGETSPVIEFLEQLIKSNRRLAAKSITNLQRLPLKVESRTDVRSLKGIIEPLMN